MQMKFKECMVVVACVKMCVLSSLVVRPRKRFIREQKENIEFGELYRSLENPDVIGSLQPFL